MKGRLRLAVATAVVAALAVVVTTAIAGGGNDIRERLTGYEEDPAPISTPGSGTFNAWIDESATEPRILYRLSYEGLEADATQAHIHFGGRRQSGGISVWLCSNLASPPTPAGTQACPLRSGTISGTITEADVVGPANQGIDPGAFGELVAAIRAGVTYANVHSTKYPTGEIRAQLERGRHDWDGHLAKR